MRFRFLFVYKKSKIIIINWGEKMIMENMIVSWSPTEMAPIYLIYTRPYVGVYVCVLLCVKLLTWRKLSS